MNNLKIFVCTLIALLITQNLNARTFGCDVCSWVYENGGNTLSSIMASKDACLAWGRANLTSVTGWTESPTASGNSGYASCVTYTQDWAPAIVSCKARGVSAEECCYNITAEKSDTASNIAICRCSYSNYDSNYSSYCPGGGCSDGVKMTSGDSTSCPAKYGCACSDKYFPNGQSENNYMGYDICDCKSWCSTGAYWNGTECVLCPVGTFKNTAGNATSCSGTCPSPGTTSGNMSTDFNDIIKCYITGGSDETGTYVYTPKCNYSTN